MNTRDTALIGFVATVFTVACCQIFMRAAGHHAQLSRAQVSTGLTICLAGVVVGLLLVLCVSAFQEAGTGWDRALGALGLALGCALLFVLVERHALHADPLRQAPDQIGAQPLAAARGAPLLAQGTSR